MDDCNVSRAKSAGYLAGAKAMREAILRDLEGFLIEAPSHSENRVVKVLATRIRAIPDAVPSLNLKPYQADLLARIENTDPEAFTERDWTTMLGLRELGLTEMREHKTWKFVPFFGVYRRRPGLTPAGRSALAALEGGEQP